MITYNDIIDRPLFNISRVEGSKEEKSLLKFIGNFFLLLQSRSHVDERHIWRWLNWVSTDDEMGKTDDI